MRTLASIQTIKNVEPIPGADAIECVSVLGWKCVAKKGDFVAGDPCVYIEIDSVLPDRPEFEFMKPRGMRVRTIKLRGQVSQGLSMPTSVLGPFANTTILDNGMDVTEMLGITKYDPPLPASLGGTAKGNFPSFLKKTNEDRIQSFPDILTKYPKTRCRVCEKLDGSSATYYLRDGEFGVCSRNLDLKEDGANSFWKVARQLDIEAKLRLHGKNVAIQGELIGEGIQKNKYGIKGQAVRFFDVFDIDRHVHLLPHWADRVFSELGLEQVPWLLDIEELGSESVESLIEMSNRKSILADTLAEGIVVRSYGDVTETFVTGESVNRGRLSFKVINPGFLLKHEE